MTIRLRSLPLIVALALCALPAGAQSRADGVPDTGGGRAAAMAGPSVDGPLHRPGWEPDAKDEWLRPAGIPDDIADSIDARCNGSPWRIVSGGVDTGRIVYRCEPPLTE